MKSFWDKVEVIGLSEENNKRLKEVIKIKFDSNNWAKVDPQIWDKMFENILKASGDIYGNMSVKRNLSKFEKLLAYCIKIQPGIDKLTPPTNQSHKLIVEEFKAFKFNDLKVEGYWEVNQKLYDLSKAWLNSKKVK